ncbi:MAG TPA: TRAP transporter small permease subunit [Bosea sp. (in: a-proteobacteria)]|jgi:TRAP-type C4-dicarboxylate transport system permease small subunit|uniref:TRAP transporter small permease n=1 Tax=Bosea sp. (in: a-proteobacteria) TaxID=1871050 RepID=UPI002E0D157F|nr:TRAP transporter small permease subunit [Bosea sp. (in: a-proteobacteria)]
MSESARTTLLALSERVDWLVARFCEGVVLLIGCALLALLTSNVVARYALDSGGFRFAQELPERLFPVFIMAGVALAVQKGGHMAVETVLAMLGRNGARLLLLVGHAIVIVSYVVLGVEIFGLAEIMAIDRSPVLGLPSSYGYYALGIGTVLIILTTLTLAIRVALIGPEAMPIPGPEEQIS